MSQRAPVPCPEMTSIRQEIDALDVELVKLLAQRQKLIESAGTVKPQRTQVRDDARIEEVVALVLHPEGRARSEVTRFQRVDHRDGRW